jgi:hypothetical protein
MKRSIEYADILENPELDVLLGEQEAIESSCFESLSVFSFHGKITAAQLFEGRVAGQGRSQINHGTLVEEIC